MIVGVIPLVWNLSIYYKRNNILKITIAVALTALTGILLFSFLSLIIYLWISILILAFWLVILYRKRLRIFLYKIGLYRIFKIKVAIVIPSNAIFNQELLNGLQDSINSSFCIYNEFVDNERKNALEHQKTDIDYVYYINDAIQQNIRFMIVHMKSKMLYDNKILDSLLRFAKSGGTIINLISRLDTDPFVSLGLQPPYSIVLDHTSGVARLAESLESELRKDDKLLLLKGPDTSETSSRRLEVLSKYLIGKRLKVDIESIPRWTAESAYRKMDLLVNSKKKIYDWIISWNDEIAMGVCKFYDDHSNIASKPKVVGFDNLPESIRMIKDPTSPFYRTIDMKMHTIGKRAAKLLHLIQSEFNVPLISHVPVSVGDLV